MAYLQISLTIAEDDRPAAVEVYQRYRTPFLDGVPGAQSKQLLVRDSDVQVLHQFASCDDAEAYIVSELFTKDIVTELAPLLQRAPDIRIYHTA